MQRSVAKNQNLLTKVSSTHTAVGAAHGTGRGLVQLLVYFVDVVRQASLHSPISVQKHMLGILNAVHLYHPSRSLCESFFFRREGVLQGQVEGCELCGMQPRMVGTMCIACDRLVCVVPRLKELDVDGSMFKNRTLPAAHLQSIHLDLLSQPTVRAQFLSEWDSPKDETPSLAKVYEIINPRDVRNQHERYRRVPRGGDKFIKRKQD